MKEATSLAAPPRPLASVPWRVYAQLVRLPNVFTALADIGLGTLVIRSRGIAEGTTLSAVWLFLASACLYSAGMVWNDYFDVEQDLRERPFRPIPSQRISRAAAARFGTVLMLLGVLAAGLAGWSSAGFRAAPLGLAGLLIVCILFYDRWLKRTWAGPLGMGTCRFLNVLLGFSAASGMVTAGLWPALVVGLYIVGVTWFARTEARQSNRPALTGAAAVMLAALMLALPLPAPLPVGTASPLFPYLLVGLGFLVGIPVIRAIDRPVPTLVQPAVKRAIMGLIVLDTVLATALAGTAGLVLLMLLLPALYLGRWIYST
jgi:4-hydroxybenzoate polyprenyltransferase